MVRLLSVPIDIRPGIPGARDSRFAEPLAQLHRDVQRVFGAGVGIEPVAAHERLHSHVLRLALCEPDGAPASTHLYLKVSKSHGAGGQRSALQARIERDFAMTARVHDAMSGVGEFGTVRPIACYPEHLAIVTEESPGETLLDRLQRDASWRPRPALMEPLELVMATAGRWIRAFQRIQTSADVATAEEMRTYVEPRLTAIARVAGDRGSELRQRVLQHIEALCPDVPAVSRVCVHANLSPSNILVDGARVTVIDFAMARIGHPLQDAARLYTQLDLLTSKPRFSHRVISRLQRALLAGFDPSLSAAEPRFRLQVLAQRVNHLASLTTRQYSAVEGAYNWFVRRQHWRWLKAEMRGRAGERRDPWA